VTVAECVEDADLADMLRSEGVNFLQGWAFGKPEIEPPWISPAKQLLPAVPALTVATEKRRAVQ